MISRHSSNSSGDKLPGFWRWERAKKTASFFNFPCVVKNKRLYLIFLSYRTWAQSSQKLGAEMCANEMLISAHLPALMRVWSTVGKQSHCSGEKKKAIQMDAMLMYLLQCPLGGASGNYLQDQVKYALNIWNRVGRKCVWCPHLAHLLLRLFRLLNSFFVITFRLCTGHRTVNHAVVSPKRQKKQTSCSHRPYHPHCQSIKQHSLLLHSPAHHIRQTQAAAWASSHTRLWWRLSQIYISATQLQTVVIKHESQRDLTNYRPDRNAMLEEGTLEVIVRHCTRIRTRWIICVLHLILHKRIIQEIRERMLQGEECDVPVDAVSNGY